MPLSLTSKLDNIKIKEQAIEMKEINPIDDEAFLGGRPLSEEEKEYEKLYTKNPTKETRAEILRKLLPKIREAKTFSVLDNIYRNHTFKNYFDQKRHPWFDKMFECLFKKGFEQYTATKIKFIEKLHERALEILKAYKRNSDGLDIPKEWFTMSFLESRKENGVNNPYFNEINKILYPKQTPKYFVPQVNNTITLFRPLSPSSPPKKPPAERKWEHYVPPKVEPRRPPPQPTWEMTNHPNGNIKNYGYNYSKTKG